MRLSGRVQAISHSLTLALDARAKELIAAGRDVINLAVGEPDFPAPERVRRVAAARIESGDVRYTPAAGSASVRAAVAAHLSATRGVAFEPAEVAVCHSAKHALSSALLALVEDGDEVLVPVPAWVSYFELITLAGGRAVQVPPTAHGGPDVAALRAACGPRTKGLLFCSPSNPSGYVWTRAETEGVAALAGERDLFLISDEIYRRLVYEGEPAVSPVSLDRATRARTIVIDGASKAFAMTGYRIGYAAAPRDVTAAIARLNSQLTGAPNTVSQAALEAALVEEPPEVAEMVAEFGRRRTFLLGELASMGLETPLPRGAFYAFPDVGRYLDERGSAGFCEDVLEQAGIAIVPGAAFGQEGHVRLSYAVSMDQLADATARLRAFLGARVGA